MEPLRFVTHVIWGIYFKQDIIPGKLSLGRITEVVTINRPRVFMLVELIE